MRLAAEVTVVVSLAIAVLVTLMCALGVMVMRNPYQRLNFSSPASTLCAALLALAVGVGAGGAQATIKAVIVLVLLAFQNGVVSHATARATYIHARKRWPPDPNELEHADRAGGPLR